MSPSLKTSDLVCIKKLIDPKNTKGDIIYIKNPITQKLRFSRVVGVEHEWIKYKPNGTFFRVPHGYLWVEQENKNILNEFKDKIELNYPTFLVKKY